MLLGFDGLEFEYTQKFLPSFVDQAYGVLIPEKNYAVTGPSWSSIYTGVKAKKHKVTDQLGQEWDEHLCLKNSPYKSSWEYIIENSDLKVGLIGMPCTFPLKPLKRNDCFIIPGFPLLDNQVPTFPPSIKKFLEKYEYVVDIVDYLCEIKDFSFWMREGEAHGWLKQIHKALNQPKVIVDACLDLAFRRIKIAKTLVDNYNTDVLYIQFGFVDHLGHLIPKVGKEFVGYLSKQHSEYINILYRIINKIREAIIEWFVPEHIIICSDHGFKKQHTMEGFYAIQQYGGYPIVNKRIDAVNYAICPTVLNVLDIDIDYDVFDADPINFDINKNIMKQKLEGLGYV